MSKLQVVTNESTRQQLEAEFRIARRALAEAEATLSQKQAAINGFRMHCRLKLDVWVDEYTALCSEKQVLLTQWRLRQQAQELGMVFDETDPFWQDVEIMEDTAVADDDLLLPTPTPNDKAAEKRLYRELARRFHPDLAATTTERAYATNMMATVNFSL